MTIFADTLRKYLESKNTTIYNIAKTSGVDRTLIQHMKTGKRLPANASVIHAIAKALMLNLSETEELIRSYDITHMGEENYYRRQHVSKIISGFYDMNAASKLILPKGMHDTLEMQDTLKEIVGRSNINRIVKAILEMEANKQGGHVKIMVQPDYTYLYDSLTSIDFNSKNTNIETIIVFDKNEGHKSTIYNLNILERLVPILFQCEVFHPYYIYENVESLFNKNSFMPYKIITSDFVIAISYEHDKALLFHDASMLNLINETFQKRLSIATPICQTFHPTPQEYLEATISTEEELQSENIYELFYQPCFPRFCPDDILLDRLNTDIISPEMKNVIVDYSAKIRVQYKNMNTFFTIEGLNYFMETGRVTEIPDFMYTYLTPPQRLTMLKAIIASVDDGSFTPRIIKSESFTIPSPICICAPNEHKVIIYYFSPDKGQYIFRLQELSLVQAFYDFLTYLHESPLVYSLDESKAMLHNLLEKYQQHPNFLQS